MKSLDRILRSFDRLFADSSEGWVAGVDEAGRGPLAGPVVAAAVMFLKGAPPPGLNDSKKLTSSRRRGLFLEIAKTSAVGFGVISESDIDRINIYQATRLAMKYAVLSLTRTPNFVLIDGTMKLDLPLPQKAVVGGDGKSASIAAASIMAKVYRDALMERVHEEYPDYQFNEHKGYATPVHLDILSQKGPCPAHRRSFSPVQKFLGLSR